MKFNGLTTWGREHLASLAQGHTPLRLSKVKVGDGVLTSAEQALALLEVLSYKGVYPISNIERQGSVVSVQASIDNIAVTQGFTAREIGIYVNDNGADKLFWYINNDRESVYIYPVSAGGTLKLDANYQMVYAENEVAILNEYGVDYFVSKIYLEEYIKSRAKVHYGPTAPTDEGTLWVDTSDPIINGIDGNSDVIKIIMRTLAEFKEIVDDMDYKLSNKLDPGVREKKEDKLKKLLAERTRELNLARKLEPTSIVSFKSKSLNGDMPDLDPSYPDLEDDYKPNMKNYPEATLKHLCIARGKRDAMGNLLGGELYFEMDEKALYVGDDKGNVFMLCKVGGGGGGGGGNLTGEYLELVSPKGVAFKVRVTDHGNLEVYKSSIDNRPLPDPDDLDKKGWDTYKASDGSGLCVNQIYSGGKIHSEDTPVSHSFIEIYNNSERDISLRGLSVQYCKMGKDWKVCPLDGMLPGNTSFLIRCQENTNPYKLACRVKVNNYDIDWDQELSPTGMKVALVVGDKPIDCPDPYKDPPRIEPIHRYIDMLAAGGRAESEKIDYAEGYFTRHCLDKNTAICRGFVKGLKDRNSSLLDTMAIDYRYASIEHYGPRCRRDGPWDIYRDKITLAENRPNMIIITFGKEQSTRIFTFQTKPTREGYIKFRKITNTVFKNGKYVKEDIMGRIPWDVEKTAQRNITHHDTSAVVHSAFLRNLSAGIYEYKAGKEGEWSDTYEFEVFHDKYGDFTSPLVSGETDADREVRMLHTTDQQGWDEYEYVAWKLASEYIVEEEKTKPLKATGRANYDWRLNTGDESQNGNRSFEWRYYYDASKSDLACTVEMSVAGNNDLVDKKKSEAYTFYTTYEESPYPSVYEFMINDIHFIAFHTWAHVDPDFKDIVSIDSDEEDPFSIGFVKKQIKWMKSKLVGQRYRWTIVLTHVAPFTIVKMKNAQVYRDVLEGFNGLYTPVDLVICGHNHSYSRSKAMLGTEVVSLPDGTTETRDKIDPLNGVYHIMSQATGFKLSGKAKPVAGSHWYAHNPISGGEAATVPPHPCYIMWKFTKDFIQMDAYQITGIVHRDDLTGETTYGDPSTYQKEKIDTFTIWHRDKRAEHTDEL